MTPRSIARARPTDGRGRKQELLDFAPDPFGREIVELNRPAERARFEVELEIEARHELDRAQHPEAVIRKCPGVDHPQAAPLEVVAAAKRIEVFVGQRIPRDGVDGEIAPPGGLLDGHVGIADDDEPFVSAPGLRVSPRQRHVDVAELEHLKALADRLDAAKCLEHAPKPFARHAEHLDVDVRRLVSEQAVADPAADDKRAAAGVADGPRDLDGALDAVCSRARPRR